MFSIDWRQINWPAVALNAMYVMALALGVRLGKPGVYVLNPQGQVPQAVHVQRSVRLAGGVVCMVVVLAVLGLLAAGGVVYG